MSRRRKKKLPVDPVRATVESLSHEGRGIAHIEGKTVFIDGALPGEEVMFTYISRRGRFDEGKATEILSASKHRVTPRCEHFGVCGGCSLQHMAPDAQLAHKQQVLEQALNAFERAFKTAFG